MPVALNEGFSMESRTPTPWLARTAPPSRGDFCEDPRCARIPEPIWYCVDCDSSFCETCWSLQTAHLPGKIGRDGQEHEKANYRVLKLYRDILHPPTSMRALQQMHEDDSDTLWFGVTKDDTGHRFEDHGRYAALMAHSGSTQGPRCVKYPQLVSFVGVTNAGKSTIIKMLIGRQSWSVDGSSRELYFPSPVVGSAAHDKTPTSGDVHLYADPASFDQGRPLLYADCEGLGGGEGLPYGSQSRKRAGSGSKSMTKRHPKLLQGRPRNIAWANNDKTRKREFAVTELYPRLLYTFSDVVVFVLRNAKTFQSSVLMKLLDWGATSLERSINQPTLPHAVIVVNASDVSIDPREWDPKVATQRILDSVRSAFDPVNGVPELLDLREKWQYDRGVPIRSVHDLILRYYASFTVVRIPDKGRYSRMDYQAVTLRNTIEIKCKESFQAKRVAHMLSTSDRLNDLLQAGFDHFTTHLDKPFNFIEVALKNNPLPEDFGDHILQLALAIQSSRHREHTGTTAQWIFKNLSHMVASCIMLDCARYRQGSSSQLFSGYKDYLDEVLQEFCQMCWPCSYENKRGQRCVNVQAMHAPKGHQNVDGRIIGPGEYVSSFSADAFGDEWIHMVRSDLEALEAHVRRREDASNLVPGLQVSLDVHQGHMSKVFASLGNARNFISHTTCFCCLRAIPEHGLACGHVLCSRCVQEYGRRISDSTWVLQSCPLHCGDPFAEPRRVWFKPEHAGVRVLSLDGGGIRGIIELEVLRSIEEAIGCELPIQAFFDLIVGTSTGGIIALALGVRQWSVADCTKEFVKLCDVAFTERQFAGVPILEQLTTMSHSGSKYKTTPLHHALQKTLGHDSLFGGLKERNTEFPINVAVASTSGTGKNALLISNYGRSAGNSELYEFVRPEDHRCDLKVWEAAAATSAAPGYFKEFYHRKTHQTFLDGALYNNNPAHMANAERKLLWPDVADRPPDLLLSIGTGQNAAAMDEALKGHHASPDRRTQHSQHMDKARLEVQGNAGEKPKGNRLLRTFRALYKRFDNILDAEQAWLDFEATTHRNCWPELEYRPYFRYNPDLKQDPPSLDAKKSLEGLREHVRCELQRPAARQHAQMLALRLVASTFYLAKDGPLRQLEDSDGQVYLGRIRCRFEDGSLHLRRLGRFLELQQRPDHGPYFVIQDKNYQTQDTRLQIQPETIALMQNHAKFDFPAIQIKLYNTLSTTNIAIGLHSNDLGVVEYPLSGFPRELAAEELSKLSRQTSAEENNARLKKSRTRRVPLNRNGSPILNAPGPARGGISGNRTPTDDTAAADHARDNSLAEQLRKWVGINKETGGHDDASHATSSSTTASVSELDGDGLARTAEPADESDPQFEADMQKAIDQSLQRRPTTDANELATAIENSRRHFVK